MRNMITMGEFIVKKQADYPTATGELTSLLSSIRLAAKVVNREINKAGLADIIGWIILLRLWIVTGCRFPARRKK